jgi:hypothetical protein
MRLINKGIICSVLFVSTLISACGGGSGSSNSGGGGMPTLPIGSAIVDVNGDGKNDFIVSNGQSADGYLSPLVYINNGSGSSFTLKKGAIPTQYHGANSAAVDIKSGDFNKDGKMDLLVITVDGSYQSSQIQLYLGNGDGSFTDASSNISNGLWPTTLPCTNTGANAWPSYLRIADIDNDGNLDFVVAMGGAGTCGGVIYRNDGTAKFSPANITITDGTNTIIATSLVDANNIRATEVLAGDLNNDGKIDLFAPTTRVWGTGGLHTAYINTSTLGAISFTAVHSTPSPILQGVLVDINGDGFLDVVGSLAYSYPNYATLMPVVAFLGDGAGGFTEDNAVFSPQPSVLCARQFLTADFNGDGKNDVLITNTGPDFSPFPGERNWLLMNNGAGMLVDNTATGLDLLSAYTHQASIGDLNGDGSPDIILNNSFQSQMSAAKEPRFWLNNGSGVFTSYNPALN